MLRLSISKINSILLQQRAFATSLQQHPYQFDLPSTPIKSLASLIQQRKDTVRDRFDNLNQNLFSYGMNPVQFKLHCFTFFKYGYWQTHPQLQERLKNFLNQCDEREKFLKQSQNETNMECNKSELSMILSYRQMLATQLLPNTISDYDLANVYIQQLSSFLRDADKLTDIDFTFITINFQRILFRTSNFKQFVNEKDNAWTIAEAFSLFLDHCVSQMDRLPVTIKSTLVSVARALHIKHLPFLQWLKKGLQKEKKEMNLQIFLSALVYLGHNNSFPFEFFYRNKDSLMSFIEAAERNSEKKITVSMYMLEIFSRQRLPYCEQILHRLLICLRENLAAADVSQLARIFYYYSRLKCSIDHQFVTSLIQRLYLFLNVLERPDYLLIIKAAASLNYRDEVLLQKLKDYDYELFLSSLKFGCSSLGSFYRQVLDEVEASFKNDSSRYYRQDDEAFSEVVLARPAA